MRAAERNSSPGGASWEWQPRFSPDGKLIAFTSDRDGGDNIWVMDADGKNRRQVTKETQRLLNTPDWTPDGQYLLARKHFVDTRSLGAGEIWMYHVNGGGKGVQLTERPNWTANIGEPVVDPQGRFVYFVASTAFDYNKNVYDSIYWIDRYDTQKGRRSTFVRGAGGSVRPAVSPDGKLSLLHPSRRPEVCPLPARDRHRARVARLRRSHARPAGDVGRLRHLSRLRLDARRQVNRHHREGQTRPRGCGGEACHADSFQRARLAEGDGGRPLAREGRPRARARSPAPLGAARRGQ